MPTTYTLTTIADLLQVPGDRRAACADEILLALATCELTGRQPTDAITWTDDSDPSCQITVPGEPQHDLTLSVTTAAPTYSYSTDGGETWRGCHDSRAAATSAALDDLASDTEPGTHVEVHTCRCVPCHEILQRQPHIALHVAEAAEETLSDWLYSEIGDEQPLRPLTDAESTALGRYILRGFARLNAYRGWGVDDERMTEEVVSKEGGAA